MDVYSFKFSKYNNFEILSFKLVTRGLQQSFNHGTVLSKRNFIGGLEGWRELQKYEYILPFTKHIVDSVWKSKANSDLYF